MYNKGPTMKGKQPAPITDGQL